MAESCLACARTWAQLAHMAKSKSKEHDGQLPWQHDATGYHCRSSCGRERSNSETETRKTRRGQSCSFITTLLEDLTRVPGELL